MLNITIPTPTEKVYNLVVYTGWALLCIYAVTIALTCTPEKSAAKYIHTVLALMFAPLYILMHAFPQYLGTYLPDNAIKQFEYFGFKKCD